MKRNMTKSDTRLLLTELCCYICEANNTEYDEIQRERCGVLTHKITDTCYVCHNDPSTTIIVCRLSTSLTYVYG